MHCSALGQWPCLAACRRMQHFLPGDCQAGLGFPKRQFPGFETIARAHAFNPTTYATTVYTCKILLRSVKRSNCSRQRRENDPRTVAGWNGELLGKTWLTKQLDPPLLGRPCHATSLCIKSMSQPCSNHSTTSTPKPTSKAKSIGKMNFLAITLLATGSSALSLTKDLKAASPFVNLGCQCSSLTFVDSQGQVLPSRLLVNLL